KDVLYQLSYMGEPASLAPEKQKSQSRRLNDLGTASSSKKRSQTISRPSSVKANSQRIRPLETSSSALPPRRRLTTKMMPIRTNSMTTAIAMLTGVTKPAGGVGLGRV